MRSQPAKIYGVMGKPIQHSLSPVMHNAAFEALGVNALYAAFEPSDLKGSIDGMRALGICGMSVTIPFKTSVIPYLDALDPLAEAIGAANTLVNENGRLKGYNTDGLGAMKALQSKMSLAGKRCVLVGGGGAARGIGFMAREMGMALVIANRSMDRGQALAGFLECPFIPLERIREIRVDVMIQTTPVGMFPHEDASPVPDDIFRKEMVVMDAIYNPLETRLLKIARAHGCVTISGLEMFIHQGAEQFRLWTGLNPPMDVMRAAVKKVLEKNITGAEMNGTKTALSDTPLVTIPGSKSITHRALIAGSLASGKTVLKNNLRCEDTRHTAHALEAMGVGMKQYGSHLIIEGMGEKTFGHPFEKAIYLGNSGTSFRLLLPVLTLAKGRFLMTGTPRMRERPMGPLVDALQSLGAKVSCINNNDLPPVRISSDGIPGGMVALPGDASSQFLSALLLSGPHAVKDVEITVIGDLVSRPYVDVTIDVMAAFGVRVEREGYEKFRVPQGQRYVPRDYTVQGDASSASYFWAGAAITGKTVTTRNINPEGRQGDIRLLEVFEAMGCTVVKESDRVSVTGGPLKGIDVDMGAMPDMVPTLAAVALFAKGKTTIRNVGHLRFKESDRLSAVTEEWRKLGGRVEEFEDSLMIHGGEKLQGVTVDPHDDHRLAMSLAVVGLKVPGIRIQNPSCVGKSFPQFWDLWEGFRDAL